MQYIFAVNFGTSVLCDFNIRFRGVSPCFSFLHFPTIFHIFLASISLQTHWPRVFTTTFVFCGKFTPEAVWTFSINFLLDAKSSVVSLPSPSPPTLSTREPPPRRLSRKSGQLRGYEKIWRIFFYECCDFFCTVKYRYIYFGFTYILKLKRLSL